MSLCILLLLPVKIKMLCSYRGFGIYVLDSTAPSRGWDSSLLPTMFWNSEIWLKNTFSGCRGCEQHLSGLSAGWFSLEWTLKPNTFHWTRIWKYEAKLSQKTFSPYQLHKEKKKQKHQKPKKEKKSSLLWCLGPSKNKSCHSIQTSFGGKHFKTPNHGPLCVCIRCIHSLINFWAPMSSVYFKTSRAAWRKIYHIH